MQGTQSWCCVTAWSLGVEREVGTGFRREGTRVRLWPVHVDGEVWQKPSQYCKVVILQLKCMNYTKKTLPLAVLQSMCVVCQTSEVSQVLISYWNFFFPVCLKGQAVMGCIFGKIHGEKMSVIASMFHTLCFKIHVSLWSHFFLLSWQETCVICGGSAMSGLRFSLEFHALIASVCPYT